MIVELTLEPLRDPRTIEKLPVATSPLDQVNAI